MRRALSLLALTFIVVCAPTYADTLTGKVVRVADGDTITVLDHTNTQHRIRLQGIDAPEKAQPYGNASRKHLAGLVAGKTAAVQWAKYDRYGRIVGTVFAMARTWIWSRSRPEWHGSIATSERADARGP